MAGGERTRPAPKMAQPKPTGEPRTAEDDLTDAVIEVRKTARNEGVDLGALGGEKPRMQFRPSVGEPDSGISL
jgi:hypothetical protein